MNKNSASRQAATAEAMSAYANPSKLGKPRYFYLLPSQIFLCN